MGPCPPMGNPVSGPENVEIFHLLIYKEIILTSSFVVLSELEPEELVDTFDILVVLSELELVDTSDIFVVLSELELEELVDTFDILTVDYRFPPKLPT